MKLPKFITGLLIGTAVGLIIWYWQKSTSAEEGALAVLDRLAAAEARVRDLEGRLRLEQEKDESPKQPEVLSGLSELWGLEPASEEIVLAEAVVEQVDFDDLIESDVAADDLKAIDGIGPTYEQRLNEAGITTFAGVAQKSPDELRTIAGLKSWQAAVPEKWIEDAQNLSEE